MFDNSGNIWISLEADENRTWTPEMVRDWSISNDFSENYLVQDTKGGRCALPDDYDITSTNLLYTTGEDYKVESPICSDLVG